LRPLPGPCTARPGPPPAGPPGVCPSHLIHRRHGPGTRLLPVLAPRRFCWCSPYASALERRHLFDRGQRMGTVIARVRKSPNSDTNNTATAVPISPRVAPADQRGRLRLAVGGPEVMFRLFNLPVISRNTCPVLLCRCAGLHHLQGGPGACLSRWFLRSLMFSALLELPLEHRFEVVRRFCSGLSAVSVPTWHQNVDPSLFARFSVGFQIIFPLGEEVAARPPLSASLRVERTSSLTGQHLCRVRHPSLMGSGGRCPVRQAARASNTIGRQKHT